MCWNPTNHGYFAARVILFRGGWKQRAKRGTCWIFCTTLQYSRFKSVYCHDVRVTKFPLRQSSASPLQTGLKNKGALETIWIWTRRRRNWTGKLYLKPLATRWTSLFSLSPTSCVGEMGVLAVMLKHTMADMQVTSLPPRWQSFTKMLILLGSNLTLA